MILHGFSSLAVSDRLFGSRTCSGEEVVLRHQFRCLHDCSDPCRRPRCLASWCSLCIRNNSLKSNKISRFPRNVQRSRGCTTSKANYMGISWVLKAFILTSQFSSQFTNFTASPGVFSHSVTFGMKVLERKVKNWLDRDVDTFHHGAISTRYVLILIRTPTEAGGFMMSVRI